MSKCLIVFEFDLNQLKKNQIRLGDANNCIKNILVEYKIQPFCPPNDPGNDKTYMYTVDTEMCCVLALQEIIRKYPWAMQSFRNINLIRYEEINTLKSLFTPELFKK